MTDAGVIQSPVEVEALECAPTVATYELDVGGRGGELIGKTDEDRGEFVFGLAWE